MPNFMHPSSMLHKYNRHAYENIWPLSKCRYIQRRAFHRNLEITSTFEYFEKSTKIFFLKKCTESTDLIPLGEATLYISNRHFLLATCTYKLYLRKKHSSVYLIFPFFRTTINLVSVRGDENTTSFI